MSTTNLWRAALASCALILVCSCGTEGDAERVASDGFGASETGDWVPAEVQELLRQNGIAISRPPDGQMGNSAAALKSFYTLYDPSTFDREPEVYFVQIVESVDTSLREQQYSELVLMTDYPMTFPVPTPAPGTESTLKGASTNTEMIAFFDSESGDHLVTEYIASPA
ncbi:hypothetical protein GCM10009812_20410 [Nocardioides marinus]